MGPYRGNLSAPETLTWGLCQLFLNLKFFIDGINFNNNGREKLVE